MADAKTLSILKQRFREAPSDGSIAPGQTPTGDNPPPESRGWQSPQRAAPEMPIDPAMMDIPPGNDNGQDGPIGNSAPQNDTPSQPTGQPAAINPNAGSQQDQMNAQVRNAQLQQMRGELALIQRKKDVLRTMPITDKDGNTGNVWEIFGGPGDEKGEAARKRYTNTDGRLRSGAEFGLQALASDPGLRYARSWGDLASSASYALGATVAGAIKSTANEDAKRKNAIAQLEMDEKDVQTRMAGEMRMANQDSLMNHRDRSDKRLEDSLNERIGQHTQKNFTTEQQNKVGMIMKRGYYYEGDNPQEDEELKALKMTLPDFDKTRPAYNDASTGMHMEWDREQRKYVQSAGDVADEPLVPVNIDGQTVRLKPAQYANFKAMEGKTNYETEKDDAKAKEKFTADHAAYLEKKTKLRSQWLENSEKSATIYGENDKLQKEKAGLDAETAEGKKRLAEINKTISENNVKMGELKGKNTGLDTEVNGLIEPVEPKPLPKYEGAVQAQKYSEDEIRARILAHNPKASADEIKAGIEKVRAKDKLK